MAESIKTEELAAEEPNAEEKKKVFSYSFHKKQLRATIIAFAVMLGFCIYGHTNILLAVVCGAAYFFIKGMEVYPPAKLNGVWAAIEIGFASWFTVACIQYMLLVDDEIRAKTTSTKFALNVLCALAVYLLIVMIGIQVCKCVMTGHILMLCLAGFDYFVYNFRGNEIIFSDIKSLGTGLSVASEYKFTIESHAVIVILTSMVFVALIRKFHFDFTHRWILRLVCAVLAVIIIRYLAVRTASYNTESWQQKGTYRNGFLLNFALSARDSIVAQPEGYNLGDIAALEAKYHEDATELAAEVPEDAPVIIGIMDESFADLSVLGDLKLNQEFMPFIESMDENVVKGYALASVFGAKTPNSEWEFLTGNTMAFLPSGSVVYQQYLSREPYSLVDILTKYGYRCISMHPYYKTGWSRQKNYPMIGFTESLFLEDFEQKYMIRDYVSDQEMFDKLIEKYEEKDPEEKLFMFGVTMQNHGGYKDSYEGFTVDTYMTNGDFDDVDQYLTVAHQTDAAVKNLIEYFEDVDEKVIICFFGDHQPSLQDAFYKKMNGSGLSGLTVDELENLFKVPFFIWTNYETETEELPCTSFNYLHTMTLERAGLPLPPYNQFLKDLQEKVPALNSRGYYSETEDMFQHFAEAEGEEKDWLREYEMLEYNSMFDRQNMSDIFFGQWLRE